MAGLRDRIVGALAGAQVGGEAMLAQGEYIADLSDSGLGNDAVSTQEDRVSLDAPYGIKESGGLNPLDEQLDEKGWIEIYGPGGKWNFSRASIRKIITISRVMYLINPLIRRAVTVQELYVWGSGVEIKAESPEVQEVLDDYFKAPKNQKVIGESWSVREREQRIDGSQFFAFHVNKSNGACRVRLFNVDRVAEIYTNPEDSTEPWFYKVEWSDDMGSNIFPDSVPKSKDPILYPDINYNPRQRIGRIEDVPINWDVRIQFVKTGGLSNMFFGLPELYSTFAYATSYKTILENFATILKAHARLALQISGLNNKTQVAATKSKLNTKTSAASRMDGNPPMNTASWAILSGGASIAPIKTANSTTGPDEARSFRSMVAAGSDTPEHFFGDSNIGNFATSTTLDRPTELKMEDRRGFWSAVIMNQCQFVIEKSARAPRGKLRLAGFTIKRDFDQFDGAESVTVTAPDGKSTKVTITFPSILQRDVVDRVRAVVQAATLGGSPAEGIIPSRKLLFKLLMVALGENDAEALMQKYYPEEVLQGFVDPAEKLEIDKIEAQGKKDLGDAALKQADAAMKTANKPTPKPNGAAGGV